MSAKSVYVTMIKVSTLKKNPQNPRQIKGERLELLKRSITEFEKMMPLQPIVVDETNTVLSGNMRLAAIKALGLKEIPDGWVKQADDLTEDEKRRLVITANSSFGEYDWDILANEWTDAPLADWGLDIPGFDSFIEDETQTEDTPAKVTLADRFLIPPFSVLDARQGYWQDRKRAWLALGIESELGRGGGNIRRLTGDHGGGVELLPQTLGAIAPNEFDILKRNGRYGKN